MVMSVGANSFELWTVNCELWAAASSAFIEVEDVDWLMPESIDGRWQLIVSLWRIYGNRAKQLIKDAVMENDFLKNLDGGQVHEMVDSMYPREFDKGSYVIREGDAGKHLLLFFFLLRLLLCVN